MEQTRTIISHFKEVTASITVAREDGSPGRTRKTVAFSAASFAEAEKAAVKYFSACGDDAQIININPAKYGNVILSDKDKCWFRVKVKYIETDERTGKEKRTASTFLVQADSSEHAQKYIMNTLNEGMTPYEVSVIAETKVEDVVLIGSHQEKDI